MKWKMSFLKGKGQNKKYRKSIAVGLVVALVGTAGGGVIFKQRKAQNAMAQTSVQSATVQKGNISTSVTGTGALQGASAENVMVPEGIKIKKVLVEAGDSVKKGQKLATVDKASVASKLLEIKEAMSDVEDAIDNLSDDADEEGTTEYLKALVLKGERKELKTAKKTLNHLLKTGVIKAEKKGIINAVYVSENTVLSSTASSGSNTGTSSAGNATQMSAVTGSSASTVTAAAVKLATGSEAENSGIMAQTASVIGENLSTTATAAMNTGTEGTEEKAVNVSAEETEDINETSEAEAQDTLVSAITLTVQAPVTGNTPQTQLQETSQFTGSMAWNPADGSFQGETTYTAEITLTAKSGYGFDSSTVVKVPGASKVTTAVDGTMLKITVTFPSTEAVKQNTTESSSEKNTEASVDKKQTGDATGNTQKSGTDSRDNTSGQQKTTGGQNAQVSGGTGSSGAASVSSTGSASSTEEYNIYEAAAFAVVNEDEAVVSINVDELDILSVQAGQSATITLDAVEGEEFEGTITSVSATATGDSSSAKYPVEITMEKTEDMKFGMSASATIIIEEAENVLLIPVSALQERGNSTFVYTETDSDGNLSGETEITTGLSDDSQVVVTSGLSEGDTVYYTRASGDSSNAMPDMGGFGGGQMPSDRGMPSGEAPSGGKGNFGGGGPQ